MPKDEHGGKHHGKPPWAGGPKAEDDRGQGWPTPSDDSRAAQEPRHGPPDWAKGPPEWANGPKSRDEADT